MTSTARPIYLFADSQLLFWKQNGALFMKSIVALLPSHDHLEAAYVGASNGDNPAFYQIFESAMHNIGIRQCQMILSSFSTAEKARLEKSDVILLAGGDTRTGWRVFQEAGFGELLARKYHAGSVLLGVSAGAIQLGLTGWTTDTPSRADLFDTFQLVPFVVGAHEEQMDWRMLKSVVSMKDEGTRGLGLPSGGGMIFHPNKIVEAVRHPLHEFVNTSGRLSHRLVLPSNFE